MTAKNRGFVKAVVFDFDGVVAKTLPYHTAAWKRVLAPHQISITEQDIALEEGADTKDIIRRIFDHKKIPHTEEILRSLTEEKRRIYSQTTRASVYPETKTFIRELKNRGYRLALVTGSVPKAIQAVADKDMLKNFEVIITSLDVVNTKPDPEGFLLAAHKLGVAPNNCLVIENAPNGIQAAKSAGMTCIALRTTINDDAVLCRADHIVDHVSDIHVDSIPELIC